MYAAGQSGGHFGANLGVIQLTVALHYRFNTPEDRLVSDVGHQAYPHKALTGRREQLSTIRAKNGLAASWHVKNVVSDTFGVGHSINCDFSRLGHGFGQSLSKVYVKWLPLLVMGRSPQVWHLKR